MIARRDFHQSYALLSEAITNSSSIWALCRSVSVCETAPAAQTGGTAGLGRRSLGSHADLLDA